MGDGDIQTLLVALARRRAGGVGGVTPVMVEQGRLARRGGRRSIRQKIHFRAVFPFAPPPRAFPPPPFATFPSAAFAAFSRSARLTPGPLLSLRFPTVPAAILPAFLSSWCLVLSLSCAFFVGATSDPARAPFFSTPRPLTFAGSLFFV
jgi:hypothetical protein